MATDRIGRKGRAESLGFCRGNRRGSKVREKRGLIELCRQPYRTFRFCQGCNDREAIGLSCKKQQTKAGNNITSWYEGCIHAFLVDLAGCQNLTDDLSGGKGVETY